MGDTYFDYILSQCKIPSISIICYTDKTCEELKKRASKEFNGCKNITANFRLQNALSEYIKGDIFNSSLMDTDAKALYKRCREIIMTDDIVGYDRLFDCLVDLNWLLASIQYSKDNNLSYVKLLSRPLYRRFSLKKYLLEMYNSAIRDYKECRYILEAQKARNRIFTGLYKFKYNESQKYLSQYFSSYDLKNLINEYTLNSIIKMALFYSLSATATLEESIRRFT